LRYDLLTEEQTLIGMHQLALTHSGAGLHRGNAGGAFGQAQSRHTGRNGARSDNQVFVLAEIELVDQRAQQVGVNLPARGDEAGADLNHDSHFSLLQTGRLSYRIRLREAQFVKT
jgi:hypothetical protein